MQRKNIFSYICRFWVITAFASACTVSSTGLPSPTGMYPISLATIPPAPTQAITQINRQPTLTQLATPIDPQIIPTQTVPKITRETTPTNVPGAAPFQVINPQNAGELKLMDYVGRGIIASIDWSPNGAQIAIASSSGIYLIDAVTWEESRLSDINCRVLAFSPNSKILATGPISIGTSEVKLRNIETLEPILSLAGFNGNFGDMEFSPDGKLLATAEGDGYGFHGAAKLWDTRTGKLLAEFGQKLDTDSDELGDYSTVWDVAFSPDGKFLVTANANGVAQFWDVAEQKEHDVMKVSEGMLFALAISPDGKLLATSGAKQVNNTWMPDLGLWDLSTGERLFELPGYKDNVFSILFSPNGQLLATLSAEGLRLWDVTSGQKLLEVEGSYYYESDIAFSPDGTLLATGEEDVVSLWGIPIP